MEQEFNESYDRAIKFIAVWAEAKAKEFPNQVRAHKPRGTALGPSRKKIRAACLEILYPTIKQADLAKWAGSTHASYRFWRTQEDFRKLASELETEFRDLVQNTISMAVVKRAEKMFDVKIDRREVLVGNGMGFGFRTEQGQESDSLYVTERMAEVVLVLKPTIQDSIMDFVRERVDAGEFLYNAVRVYLLRKSFPGTRREWFLQPEVMRLMKNLLKDDIKTIASPRAWREMGREKIQETALDHLQFVLNIWRVLGNVSLDIESEVQEMADEFEEEEQVEEFERGLGAEEIPEAELKETLLYPDGNEREWAEGGFRSVFENLLERIRLTRREAEQILSTRMGQVEFTEEERTQILSRKLWREESTGEGGSK